MKLRALLQVLVGVLDHLYEVFDLLLDLVDALDIVEPLMHVLGFLDLKFIVVQQGLRVEVPQKHHGCHSEDDDE